MPNINHFDRLYRRTKTALGVDGTTIRIRLEPVGSNTLRVLTHVTVENKSNDYDQVRLGIESTGRRHYIDELKSPSEAELAVSRSDILLGEGDVFFVELINVDNNDQLVMTCVGWEQQL